MPYVKYYHNCKCKRTVFEQANFNLKSELKIDLLYVRTKYGITDLIPTYYQPDPIHLAMIRAVTRRGHRGPCWGRITRHGGFSYQASLAE